MIDIGETAVNSLCTSLNVYGNEYADETIRMLTALRQALTDQETRNAAQLHYTSENLSAKDSAIAELNQRNRELTAALSAMCEEFCGYSKPYDSASYAKAISLLKNTATFTPQRSQDELIVKLKSALRPFAEFAMTSIIDNNWGNNIHKESISTWFGPSDFVSAAKALEQYVTDITQKPCPFCDSSNLAVMRGGDAEFYVHCEECGSSATITQWNKRAKKG